MTEKSGTFLVTEADDGSAVLSDVADGQVHALSSNPGVEAGEAIEGTVAAEPPLEVTWTLVEVAERRPIRVERVDEPPGERARAIAPADPGDMAREATDGDELHVLAVGDDPEAAAVEVAGDTATRARAARLGAERVEVRAGDGLVSVRYA